MLNLGLNKNKRCKLFLNESIFFKIIIKAGDGYNMNLKNKKYVAIIAIIVIFITLINFQQIDNNNVGNFNENNFNNYYIVNVFNMVEEQMKDNGYNFQQFRINNIILNYCEKYVVSNINSYAHVYKLKYTAVANELCRVYNDSVFIALYIHKCDGKKEAYI